MGLGASALAGLATGGPAGAAAGVGKYFIASLVTSFIGGLASMFKKPPKRELTVQEIQYNRLVNFYHGVGERQRAAREVAAMMTGKPIETFKNIGFRNTNEAMQHFGTDDIDKLEGMFKPVTKPVAMPEPTKKPTRKGIYNLTEEEGE